MCSQQATGDYSGGDRIRDSEIGVDKKHRESLKWLNQRIRIAILEGCYDHDVDCRE